jgi:hypothetical protein
MDLMLIDKTIISTVLIGFENFNIKGSKVAQVGDSLMMSDGR